MAIVMQAPVVMRARKISTIPLEGDKVQYVVDI
jgi:hypothetical protein